jgi:hypothetical protein
MRKALGQPSILEVVCVFARERRGAAAAAKMAPPYNAAIDALVPLKTPTERTARRGTIAGFFVMEGSASETGCALAAKADEVAAEPPCLHGVRSSATGDPLLHELAFLLTTDRGRHFATMQAQQAAPSAHGTVTQAEIVALSERWPLLLGTRIGLMLHMLPRQ